MKPLSEAFERAGRAALEAGLSMNLLGQQFHAELIVAHIPPEMLSDPEFQRRVRFAMSTDPHISLGGHLLEVAAKLEAERANQ
jgi:hypothetical protein